MHTVLDILPYIEMGWTVVTPGGFRAELDDLSAGDNAGADVPWRLVVHVTR